MAMAAGAMPERAGSARAKPGERVQRGLAGWLAGGAIVMFARAVTAVRPRWDGCAPEPRQRVYFANHSSHGDSILIWAVLPERLRRSVRPVAGADYWQASALRRFIAAHVFDSLLIDRDPASRRDDPVAQMAAALDEGASLILFPEGTRNTTDAPLLPFRSGLYHLAAARPEVELVPVWIDNLNRVLPKGALVPVPLICTVGFGVPLRLEPGEEKGAFLARAEAALRATAPARGAP